LSSNVIIQNYGKTSNHCFCNSPWSSLQKQSYYKMADNNEAEEKITAGSWEANLCDNTVTSTHALLHFSDKTLHLYDGASYSVLCMPLWLATNAQGCLMPCEYERDVKSLHYSHPNDCCSMLMDYINDKTAVDYLKGMRIIVSRSRKRLLGSKHCLTP